MKQDPTLPYVICHMLTSLDGKITFGQIRGSEVKQGVFDEYLDLYNQTHEKMNGKVWMCGTNTMEMFAKDINTELDEFDKEPEAPIENIIRSETGNYAITVDRKARIRWQKSTITLKS